jgi:hypothetical protein
MYYYEGSKMIVEWTSQHSVRCILLYIINRNLSPILLTICVIPSFLSLVW